MDLSSHLFRPHRNAALLFFCCRMVLGGTSFSFRFKRLPCFLFGWMSFLLGRPTAFFPDEIRVAPQIFRPLTPVNVLRVG